MWEYIARVSVTPNTLEKAPDGRECRQESQEAGAGRVALPRIMPMIGVQAEE